MRRERGFASAQFLVLLLFIAAAGLGLSLYLGSSLRHQKRSADAESRRQLLARSARSALDYMAENLEDDEDSPHDPLWAGISDAVGASSDGAPGTVLTVADVSSALNPNFVRKELLEKTSLGRLMDSRSNPQALQQYREDEGLSTNLAFYSQFFVPEARPLLTCYGWANINITDEFVLRSLYAALTDYPEGAEVFHTKVQELLMTKHILQRSELASFLGADRSLLFPVLCVEPPLNVNYVDPTLLGAILAHPDYGLKDAAARCSALLSMRESRALTEADIRELLGVKSGHILLQYFGAHTWFWEVTAREGGASCTLVAARAPSLDSSSVAGRVQLRVVETRFSP